jgi:hypothetical protein
MKLPNPEDAFVDIRKLRDYCLSPTSPRGRNKARVFAAALGLAKSDAPLLQSGLLKAALREECIPGEEDDYGKRYTVDFRLRTAFGSATIRSGWIVRTGEDFPRLTTCYVVTVRRSR